MTQGLLKNVQHIHTMAYSSAVKKIEENLLPWHEQLWEEKKLERIMFAAAVKAGWQLSDSYTHSAYDPAFPILGAHKDWKHVPTKACTWMFIATLFVTVEYNPIHNSGNNPNAR